MADYQKFKFENKRLTEENRYLKKKVGATGGNLKVNPNDDFDELAAYKVSEPSKESNLLDQKSLFLS